MPDVVDGAGCSTWPRDGDSFVHRACVWRRKIWQYFVFTKCVTILAHWSRLTEFVGHLRSAVELRAGVAGKEDDPDLVGTVVKLKSKIKALRKNILLCSCQLLL